MSLFEILSIRPTFRRWPGSLRLDLGPEQGRPLVRLVVSRDGARLAWTPEEIRRMRQPKGQP